MTCTFSAVTAPSGIAARNFVLAPWADLDPELEIPAVGRIGDLCARAGRAGLEPWSG